MTLRQRLGRWLGLDGAVAFTLSARLLNIVSSTGTVLLILHFFSPIEQGYYYSLLSLVSLQMIFELGFSFVILQMAAHESAHLCIHDDGRIEGDPVAHARLASVLQLTTRWYLCAAAGLGAILLPLGMVFFWRQDAQAAPHVAWIGPWSAAVLAVAMSFLTTPLYSFIEGANHVRVVARARMHQALASLVMSWGAIASGHGLYAPAMVNFGAVAVGIALLLSRRRLLMGLMRHPAAAHPVSWRRDVWPFQWKIAVSWLSSYLTLQIFTPILFLFRSPLEAGRMGLSLSIVTYIPILALCWITPKAASFGQLVMLGRTSELDAMFFRALKQSFALGSIMAASCLVCLRAIEAEWPKVAGRMEPTGIFVLLVAAALSSILVQGLAVYLRSFKREPYLAQSIGTAVLTSAVALLTVRSGGAMAVAVDYCAVSGVIGLAWAVHIFQRSRTGELGVDASPQTTLPCTEQIGASHGL